MNIDHAMGLGLTDGVGATVGMVGWLCGFARVNVQVMNIGLFS